jgi:hypothetical protein
MLQYASKHYIRPTHLPSQLLTQPRVVTFHQLTLSFIHRSLGQWIHQTDTCTSGGVCCAIIWCLVRTADL